MYFVKLDFQIIQLRLHVGDLGLGDIHLVLGDCQLLASRVCLDGSQLRLSCVQVSLGQLLCVRIDAIDQLVIAALGVRQIRLGDLLVRLGNRQVEIVGVPQQVGEPGNCVVVSLLGIRHLDLQVGFADVFIRVFDRLVVIFVGFFEGIPGDDDCGSRPLDVLLVPGSWMLCTWSLASSSGLRRCSDLVLQVGDGQGGIVSQRLQRLLGVDHFQLGS